MDYSFFKTINIMKFRSIYFTALCTLMMGMTFTACSDDDDEPGKNDEGSKIELPSERVYILNEGAYQANNAGVTFYAPNGNASTIADIYYTQNNVRLGDTGQDIIEYDDYIYVTVYGSQYITKLNEAGVELARYSFNDEQGQPRYMAAEDGKIYVTLYSGNVARLDAKTLAFEKMVKVGNNPEQIIEHDDKVYCVNSGWGADNRLSIIDTKNFNTAEQVEIFANPEQIVEAGDKIIIQGYGGAYPDYTYPVAVYNEADKSYTEIGKGTKIAEHDDIVYIIYSETDWSTYTTTNTFYTYNAKTGKVNNASFLKNAPAEVTAGSIYMFDINPKNGDIYIGTSDYTTNGDIYRFKNDGTFIEQFESGSVSPKKAIFIY